MPCVSRHRFPEPFGARPRRGLYRPGEWRQPASAPRSRAPLETRAGGHNRNADRHWPRVYRFRQTSRWTASASWVLGASNTIIPGYGVTVSGTLTNLGTISGLATVGSGMTVVGGSIVNAVSGRISGAKYGVCRAPAPPARSPTRGLIAGTAGSGVALTVGGMVRVVTGWDDHLGVDVGVTIEAAARGTVISGGSIAGAKGTAVAKCSPPASPTGWRFIRGAVFTGKVNGGGTGSTLELGSAAGRRERYLAFGSSNIWNFGTIALDSGAHWSVAGPVFPPQRHGRVLQGRHRAVGIPANPG